MKLTKILCLSILAFPSLGFSSFAMQEHTFNALPLEERLQPHLKLEPQPLYDYAVKLRKGEIVGYAPTETKKASFLCFREVFIKTKNYQDKTLFGKAAHNLGNIYYQWNHPKRAAEMCQLAEATGIKEAGRNLEKLRQQKVLSEPKKPNIELAQELENTQRNIANKAIEFVSIADQVEQDLLNECPT